MDPTPRQFNLIIAYLIPGFIGLVGFEPLIPAVHRWLQPVEQGDLGFGPPIYALLAAVAVGQIISCFRWVLLDQFHHLTGLKAPAINFTRLSDRLDGLDYLVQNHFRYYEFSGHTLLAVLWAYSVYRVTQTSSSLGTSTDWGMIALSLVLLTASRDALSKYYARTRQLLGEAAEKDVVGDPMYNGIGHHEGVSATKPKPQSKPEGKAATPKKTEGGKGKGAASK